MSKFFRYRGLTGFDPSQFRRLPFNLLKAALAPAVQRHEQLPLIRVVRLVGGPEA